MEIKVLEQEKNKLKIEITGETHTLCNAIRNELWNNKSVEIAGYQLEHPMVSSPVLMIETEKEDPKKALLNAASSLKKKISDLRKQADKLK
ncbi:MAG: DNA-directed RNA polymerase subunit L [Nanoarchaeota archaeon]|nr:DNA-directed RNA polymerase subunit L [Nanoarchaeota archaeon]MBU0962898.1 DNA-directed RNA polymerase subunit L [Nanoarchaeota archaeon]